MGITWSPDGSRCPICAGPGRQSTRHPAALCESCQESVVDQNGNSVQLFNESFSGGLEISISGKKVSRSTDDAENFPLYAKRIECRAREYRFGGVVVQPLEAWNVLDKAERSTGFGD